MRIRHYWLLVVTDLVLSSLWTTRRTRADSRRLFSVPDGRFSLPYMCKSMRRLSSEGWRYWQLACYWHRRLAREQKEQSVIFLRLLLPNGSEEEGTERLKNFSVFFLRMCVRRDSSSRSFVQRYNLANRLSFFPGRKLVSYVIPLSAVTGRRPRLTGACYWY